MTEPAGAGPPPGVKGEVTVLELSRQERSVARRSAETRAIVPSVELLAEVELPAGAAEGSEDPASLPAILATVGRTLRRFPRLNGAYRDGRYELYSRINIGVSLAGADAYVTATIFDADASSPAQIAAELADLTGRAEAGQLSSAELSGATFTVVASAAAGVSLLTPLIQAPQAAALAVGTARALPIVRAGSVVVGRGLTLALACDHRIVQAPQASAFLAQLKAMLEA